MKKFWTFFVVLSLAIGVTACAEEPVSPPDSDAGGISATTAITLTFGETVVTGMLNDSQTAKAFLERLPLTIAMNRYADREYYAAIDELPENGERIDDYENGDITYFTNGKSLAIFFGNAETSSQSGLIRMGRITSDLEVFDGMANEISVTIALDEKNNNEQYLKTGAMNAYREICDAMVRKDLEALRKLMSEDIIMRHMSGATQTREEWLEDIRTERLRYDRIDVLSLSAEITGNLIAVTHTSDLHANAYGANGTFRMSGTSYFVRTDDGFMRVNAPD